MISSSDPYLRTNAYVLRRTNYGEADRILNLITPVGKISAIAKGSRKEKSKLAGGVELFSLIDISIHQGKNSTLGIVTGSKMLEHHSAIVKDLEKLELASQILKKINSAPEGFSSSDFFDITSSTLAAIDHGCDLRIIETWFLIKYAKACGEDLNIYRDTAGQKLAEAQRYYWDFTDMALAPHASGDIDSDIIKVMRLMWTTDLATILRIKNIDFFTTPIFKIARALGK